MTDAEDGSTLEPAPNKHTANTIHELWTQGARANATDAPTAIRPPRTYIELHT